MTVRLVGSSTSKDVWHLQVYRRPSIRSAATALLGICLTADVAEVIPDSLRPVAAGLVAVATFVLVAPQVIRLKSS